MEESRNEVSTLGPAELVEITITRVKVIPERMKIAQDRQKSYVDNRRWDMEFKVGDYVFLWISPRNGIMRFVKKGKLSPKYINPMKFWNEYDKLRIEWLCLYICQGYIMLFMHQCF